MRTAITVVVVLISLGVVVAVSVRLSLRSPAALSEEDTPRRPRFSEGVGRPAGPDAEPMGVRDRGELVTGPPPPGGVPTDAPPPRPARRSRRSGPDRAPARVTGHTGISEPAPSDLAVALRGLERRYHELFDALGEHESPDDLARRRAADGWSAIDHIVAAAGAIADADRALETTLISDAPTVRRADVDPTARPQPTSAAGSVDEWLAELGRRANAAADRIERVPAASWSRRATVDSGSGRTITALEIARVAVEAGVAHLRAASNVLSAVRGSPVDPD
jgi:hypothetical protein